MLTGSGAEIVATANQLSLADQLACGHWRTVLTQAKQWAIAENQNLWTVLSSRALKPLLPSWLRYSPKTWLNQGVGCWPDLGSFDIAPWITPRFAKHYRLWHRNRQLIEALRRSPIEQTFDQLALRCLSGVWANWHLNNAQGVHIAQPFLDPRLIRFSLSLPHAIRDVPGQSKPLLQTAMQGILPAKILQRQYKANFNEPYWKGLNANLEDLKALIRRSPFLELQGTLPPLFTADRLEHCLEKHAVGIGDIGSGSHLCRTLSLMAWWERQS